MKVVLGTDGSSQAQFVEEVLSRYPLGNDAELHCCSAYSATRILTATSHPFLGPILADQLSEAVELAKESAHKSAAESANRLKTAGFSAKGLVLEGDSADALARYAQAQNAAFVAVGSRGSGALDTLLLGSVARDLANDNDVDLLVCRARPFVSQAGLSVVFATDHSDFANTVASKLPSIIAGKFTKLEVVSVLDPDSRELRDVIPNQPDVREGLIQWIEQHTAETASRLAPLAEEVSHSVLHGHAREELSKKHDCDLIIMGARGRSGLSRLLLGSVSHYVLTRAACSVMILRA